MPNAASRLTRATWTGRMAAEAPLHLGVPFLPKPLIRRVQARRVTTTVQYAQTNVPYYRETMRRLLLTPADIRTASDLTKLPIIERDQVQRDPEYFLSERWPASACLVHRSGGTTGTPLTVFRDPPSLLIDAAQRERQRSLVARLSGHPLRYREANVTPRDSSVADAMRSLARTSVLPTRLRVHRQSFSMFRAPADLLDELEQFRPHVISSYGSYLETLFTDLRARGRLLPSVRVATYGADAFSATARTWVKAEFGIDVLGSYNAIEAPQIGFECDHHRGYHLNIDLCPVALVDPDGHPVRDGEEGEVVISNLVNRATVLLNYRLGDTAALLSERCTCGRVLPLCSYLGRTKTAWLDLGAGETVHAQALRLVPRSEADVWRYQIVQEAERSFLLRVVARPDADRTSLSAQLVEGLREYLPSGCTVRTEFVSDLPRTPSGKVQPVLTLGRQS